MNIPLSKPVLGKQELINCRKAISSGWISSDGPFNSEFESKLAEYLDVKFALTVNNGTSAVHLALAALNVGKGDEVIVPSFGFVAFANAVLYVGAKPVFVDVSLETWSASTELISQAITSKTKAVIAVHNYGFVDDLNVLADLCKIKGIFLIEDTAEALGGELNSRKLGSFGDISTFSFYGNKIITSGEGGAVVTNNPELLNRMRFLRGQAMDPDRRYYFSEMGYNFRLSNISSAILCSQVRRLPKLVRMRDEIFTTYSRHLKDVPGVHFPRRFPGSKQAPWLFTILIDANRDSVALKLAALGIETRPTFFPIPELPAFFSTESTFPNTKHISEHGLSLPTYAEMKYEEILSVCHNLSNILASEQIID